MNKVYQHGNQSHRSNVAQGNSGAGSNARIGGASGGGGGGGSNASVGGAGVQQQQQQQQQQTNNSSTTIVSGQQAQQQQPTSNVTNNASNSNNNNNSSNSNHGHHNQTQQQHHHHSRQHGHNPHHQHHHHNQHHHQQQSQHHHPHHQQHLHHHQQQQQPTQQPPPQQQPQPQPPQTQPPPPTLQQSQHHHHHHHHSPHPHHPQNPAYVPHHSGPLQAHDVLDHSQPQQQHHHQTPQQQQSQQSQQVQQQGSGAPPAAANQQQNNQHNPVVKHYSPPIPQQQQVPPPPPLANSHLHPQATPLPPQTAHHNHHQHHHHHNQQQHHPHHPIHHQPQQMPISPSMPPQQHWVGGHPPPPSHPSQTTQSSQVPPLPPPHHQHPSLPPQAQHHQQQSNQQQQPPPPTAQQQQSGPPPAHPHMAHPQASHIMLNQQYPNHNFLYTQMGHPFVPPAGHVPQYDHHSPAASHRPDPVSINSQQQQQQQQPVSISNHHPGNMPPPLAQMPAVISTASTGTTNVHQINNNPMMEAHMSNHRLPLNQQAYMIPNPYLQNPFISMVSYPLANLNAYPGGHMPPPNPAMMTPIRHVNNELGIRPPYDLQTQTTPLPAAPTAMSQPPGSKPLVPVPQPAMATPVTPATPIKPRAKKALAIVDPVTKHVFSEAELKGSPSTTAATTPQSQSSSSKDSGVSRISPKDSLSGSEKESQSDESNLRSDSTTSDNPIIATTTTVVTAPPAVTLSTSTPTNSPLPSTVSTTEPKKITTTPATVTATTPVTVPEAATIEPVSKVVEATVDTAPAVAKSEEVPVSKPALGPPTISIDSGNSTSSSNNNNNNSQNIFGARVVEPKEEKAISTTAVTISVSEKAIENGDKESQRFKEENDLSRGLKVLSVVDEKKDSDGQQTEVDTEEADAKKPTLPNLPYAAGQFSPLNPNGIRKYNAEFLKAVAKAMNINPLDSSSAPNHRIDFAPHYVNQGPGGGNFRGEFSSSQPLTRRSSQQVINKPRRVINTHSLQQEVELKTAEKPWKPELEEEKSKIIETGEMDTKRLLKVFRGHLNKLTPQKYDSIIEKIEALDLNGPERLSSVIDLVFDKAVDEPGFCELYARMCKVIASRDSQFCFHLVRKCQEEFESDDLYDGLNVDERKLTIENELDLVKKKLLSDELYEDMRLRRKKYLGTIKLIGEMYKFGLLLSKIIALCMQHLLTDASNENIECLCSLIGTVGQKMANEHKDTKARLKQTLDLLHDMANSKKSDQVLESRIKFKILDTIDLSRRNWRPRMVENNPKKIEEIREEAKEELLRQQHQNHSGPSKNSLKNDDRDRGHRRPGTIFAGTSFSSAKKDGGKW